MSPSMSTAAHVGRLGALAVALGVGAAIASGSAVARADDAGHSSSATHDTSASASNSRTHRASSGPSSAAPSGTASKSAKRASAPAATATVSPSRVPRITAATASVPASGAGGSPTTPATTPALWALAASARREFEPSRSTSQAASATTSQPVTPAAAVVTSPSTLKSSPVGWVTGQANNAYPGANWDQTNNTASFNIWGTDVGVMWENGVTKNIQVAFGDTFSGPNMNGDWRSNVLLLSNNIDLVHGLELLQTGPAFQFIPSAPGALFPILNSEVTIIPTSAVSVNDEQYVNYMSVKSWDTPGRWTTNYSAISHFVPGPNGGKWVLVPSTIRSAGWFRSSTPYKAGNQNFQQAAYVLQPADQVPDGDTQYLYAFGTPSGRAGSAFLSRVAVGSETDLSKYEYWDGSSWVANKPAVAVAILGDSTKSAGLFGFIKDIANNPKFFGGYFAGLTGAKTGGNVSEMSVQYNDYLDKYVVLYANGSNNVVLRTADTPEGPWSDPVTIATSLQYPGLYAPMIHPWSGTGKLNSEADGSGTPDVSNLYWNMSIWSNYNVVLMQTDLSPLKPTVV